MKKKTAPFQKIEMTPESCEYRRHFLTHNVLQIVCVKNTTAESRQEAETANLQSHQLGDQFATERIPVEHLSTFSGHNQHIKNHICLFQGVLSLSKNILNTRI